MHFYSDDSNTVSFMHGDKTTCQEFTCAQDWGYRMIAFDAALLNAAEQVVTENQVERPRKSASKLFLFLENRTSQPQTIRLNMPITHGSAYYEVFIASNSTKDSFIQVGWSVLDAPIRAEVQTDAGNNATVQDQKSVNCLGVGSVKRTYAVDGVDVMPNSQRWTAGAARPYSKMSFKPGSVLGCHVDLDLGRITVSAFVCWHYFFTDCMFVTVLFELQKPRCCVQHGYC